MDFVCKKFVLMYKRLYKKQRNRVKNKIWLEAKDIWEIRKEKR
jgi:hypothetical protein